MRYLIEVLKSSEGGPSIKAIRERAKEMGLVIKSEYSHYVAHTAFGLVKGTKTQYRKLLREFGCDYLR